MHSASLPRRALGSRPRRRTLLRACAPCALFTGIVQGTASVASLTDAPCGARLRLAFPAGATAGVATGASVSVAGVCLTVVAQPRADELEFDVVGETLRVTTLGTLRPGAAVNFERAARVGDELGGHTVSGHVSASAAVAAVSDEPGFRRLRLAVPDGLARFVFPKGYVALDGASLTVGGIHPGPTFDVFRAPPRRAPARVGCAHARAVGAVIPETLRATTLGSLQLGDRVNLELDSATVAAVTTVERWAVGAVGRELIHKNLSERAADLQ